MVTFMQVNFQIKFSKYALKIFLCLLFFEFFPRYIQQTCIYFIFDSLVLRSTRANLVHSRSLFVVSSSKIFIFFITSYLMKTFINVSRYFSQTFSLVFLNFFAIDLAFQLCRIVYQFLCFQSGICLSKKSSFLHPVLV